MPDGTVLTLSDGGGDSKAVVRRNPASAESSSSSSTHHDVTRSYFLDPSSIRNYDALTEQLLEDHQRPQRTQVHLDINLSVDLDLTPEVYGDLHMSMLCVTVKRKPWEEDIISRDGRRIAGTVLRISDGRGNLVHRQVVGFESFGEWWWVVTTQLRELVKARIRNGFEASKKTMNGIGIWTVCMILIFPTVIAALLCLRLFIHF
ncbi:hypothetical protein TWF694_001541 [Orbilia ellipsospora]|uniref:Uncharacterized protein n=1 Tax=Orbilia ellipsospora TaxID=2528407 RepID=A0AAV9XSC7_9PEZI